MFRKIKQNQIQNKNKEQELVGRESQRKKRRLSGRRTRKKGKQN